MKKHICRLGLLLICVIIAGCGVEEVLTFHIRSLIARAYLH